MFYMGFSQELSLTASTLFAEYLNEQLSSCGVDLSQTIRQTDNGSEYTGGWQAKEPSSYTKMIESVPGQRHVTIPQGAHRHQADVETVHNLVEMEFYELEEFADTQDFLNKAYTYQLFFNLLRPNSYKEGKTPWQLAKEKNLTLPIAVALIPPIIIDDLLETKVHKTQKVGYDVPSTPSKQPQGLVGCTIKRGSGRSTEPPSD